MSLDEIIDLDIKKEKIVLINKIMHNEDLEYLEKVLTALNKLNIRKPEIIARATEHIPEMIEYVETLKYKYDGEAEEVEKLNELRKKYRNADLLWKSIIVVVVLLVLVFIYLSYKKLMNVHHILIILEDY